MAKMIKAVVLAAGKGTRMQADDRDAPKVMREACGKPMLWYVLDALSFIEKKDVVIVVGYMRNEIIDSFKGYRYAFQYEQLGTGHAVMSAGDELSEFDGAVLVCYGDMRVISRETYETLINEHFERDDDCTILSGDSAADLPYGRIIRDQNGSFQEIVEAGDCTTEQLMITELNSGVYVFRAEMLLKALKSISNDNAQGEYYLTDVPAIMLAGGAKVGIHKRSLGDEIIGVNTPAQLKQVEEIITARISENG